MNPSEFSSINPPLTTEQVNLLTCLKAIKPNLDSFFQLTFELILNEHPYLKISLSPLFEPKNQLKLYLHLYHCIEYWQNAEHMLDYLQKCPKIPNAFLKIKNEIWLKALLKSLAYFMGPLWNKSLEDHWSFTSLQLVCYLKKMQTRENFLFLEKSQSLSKSPFSLQLNSNPNPNLNPDSNFQKNNQTPLQKENLPLMPYLGSLAPKFK